MKRAVLILTLFTLTLKCSFGQSKDEIEIIRLDQLESTSIYKADTISLLKLWAKDYVVNNPYGEIVTVPQILSFIRTGQIDYSTVERVIERVTFTQNIAISMGHEVVTPQNLTNNAGKIVTRRYTHIWIKTKGQWRLTARQATIFTVQLFALAK